MASKRGVSALEHIARMLWLNAYHGDNLMALLYTGFFDASGKKDSHASVTVAGAVASARKWYRFEQEWVAVLKSEGVTDFHATDFAASLGEYKQWKGDTRRRSTFLKRLVEIIRRTVNKIFIVTVEMDAWNSVNKEYLLEEYFFSPFALAGYCVVDLLLQWQERREKRRNLKIIFEDGDDLQDWRGLKKLCEGKAVVPERFSKSAAIPCQIGDLIAWKTRIASQNSLRINKQIKPSEFDPELLRRVVKELESLDNVLVNPAVNGVLSPKRLIQTCKEMPIPKRASVDRSIRGL